MALLVYQRVEWDNIDNYIELFIVTYDIYEICKIERLIMG
jgi:hypothetical protein